MKKLFVIITAAAAVFASAAFAGCKPSYDRTTFVLDTDGSVRQYIVEDADEDTTISELKSYVESSLAEYQGGSGTERIRLEQCDIRNGKVKISLAYAACEDYAAYNGVVCFDGTPSEAEAAGYEPDRSYLTPGGGSISYGSIAAEGTIRVLVMNEVTSVVVPGTLLAYSDNVEPGPDGILSTIPDTDESVPEEFRTVNFENAYIIYEL